MERDPNELLIRQMLRSIEAPPQDVAKLGELVSNLESQFTSLEGVTDAWRRSFGEAWSVLEETFAVVLDRKQEALDQESLRLLSEATGELRALLGRALQDLSSSE